MDCDTESHHHSPGGEQSDRLDDTQSGAAAALWERSYSGRGRGAGTRGAWVAAGRGEAGARAARALTVGVANVDGAGDTVDVAALAAAGCDKAGAAWARVGEDCVTGTAACTAGAMGVAEGVAAKVMGVTDGVGVADAVGDGAAAEDCGLKLPPRLP